MVQALSGNPRQQRGRHLPFASRTTDRVSPTRQRRRPKEPYEYGQIITLKILGKSYNETLHQTRPGIEHEAGQRAGERGDQEKQTGATTSCSLHGEGRL